MGCSQISLRYELERVRERMDRISPIALQLRHPIVKLSYKFERTLRLSCASKREEAGSKKWRSRSEDGVKFSPNCGRRRVLAVMAWPLLMPTLGKNAMADVTEDPVEMAVVAVLDARDMIPALSTFFLQAKSKFGPSLECKSRHKALLLLYNRLKINLPTLVQELEINEEFSEQLLQGLALVEEDMCAPSMVPAAGMIENSSISRVNVEGSLKSLKLARSKVDVLLRQVPNELLELAQLARGVRPMA